MSACARCACKALQLQSPCHHLGSKLAPAFIHHLCAGSMQPRAETSWARFLGGARACTIIRLAPPACRHGTATNTGVM
jgi:hypothetical protein